MPEIATELHPFEPFIPDHARILIMGTFPPKPSRWSMEFYYPNKINDFWRIMGIVFYDNESRFIDPETKEFRLHDIKTFLTERGIAMNDTGYEVRRLKDNASDKWLEIVKPVDLALLLQLMPHCHAIATTGEKAARTLADLTGSNPPKMGHEEEARWSDGRLLRIFRMPSTSRAYPMSKADKAAYYSDMFRKIGLL